MYEDPAQIEFFYLRNTSSLSGSNFKQGTTPLTGIDDSIDTYHPIPLHPKTRLSAYWPYVVMQKPNLSLYLVNYYFGPIESPALPWQDRSLGITAIEGTALAIVPQASLYENPFPAALVYRRDDGLLSLCSLNYNGTCYNMGMATLDLPQTSSFGIFAVAQENDLNHSTDMYILYQNASNDLNYAYYSGSLWEPGGASDALKNADASTDIACLTEAIWSGQAVMSTAYDMSRCYFMSGGQIREVGFDGKTWVDMGYVPLT
ncbi:hypothetical protein F4680DRAFT_453070 [Xylaria scruposa]|nr:hypothetical protein F4680DRAFT_453070 [Xylaria scruposa]